MPRLRILHVEDDAIDALLFQDQLQRAGLSVEITRAVSAAEAESALGRDAVDLVITDNRLPGWSARGVLDLVARLRPGTPVIVLTGGMDEADVTTVLASGAAACLEKHDVNAWLSAIVAELRS